MRDIVKKVDGNKLLLQLSKKIYERDSVLAAAYKFTDRCIILIEPIGDEYVGVYFEPKERQSQNDLEQISKEFCNEVLDQQLRIELEARYGNIKEMIVRHSFSPLADLKKAIKKNE